MGSEDRHDWISNRANALGDGPEISSARACAYEARVKRLSLFVGLVVAGCAADAEVDTASEATEPVIGGVVTRDRPEVGIVNFNWGSYCTATLIAPTVAITAGHCVKYMTRDTTGSYGNFRIDKSPTGSARYAVDRFRSYAHDGVGSLDVALLRLATAVPADVATPAPIATSRPSNGTALTLYGYGCNDDWEHQTGGGTKRNFHYALGTTLRDTLCPGDSGGPVRVDSTGAVLLINSGWVSSGGDKHDVFGEVPQYASKINAQISAWHAADPTNGLTAEYFDTAALEGDPKVTRIDPNVDFDWGSGSPDGIVQNDSFAARWSGWITAPTTDTYKLEAFSDDGVRLYLDDTLVIDGWTDHSPGYTGANVSFTAGTPRKIRLEYYENGGGAVARLFWSAGTARRIVPSSAFTR